MLFRIFKDDEPANNCSGKRKIRGILNDNIIVMDAFIRSWNHTDTILKVYLTYIFRYCQGFWNFLCGILVHIVRINGYF